MVPPRNALLLKVICFHSLQKWRYSSNGKEKEENILFTFFSTYSQDVEQIFLGTATVSNDTNYYCNRNVHLSFSFSSFFPRALCSWLQFVDIAKNHQNRRRVCDVIWKTDGKLSSITLCNKLWWIMNYVHDELCTLHASDSQPRILFHVPYAMLNDLSYTCPLPARAPAYVGSDSTI